MAKKRPKTKGKQVAKPAPVIDNITNDVIAAAYSAATPPLIPVFLKVCRLCESKDGPFLNIFEADRLTAKKIDDLMPFSVAENDDLPHKICFRCSAKLEELYEFIQKCIKTQQNLRNAVGKTGSFVTKSKMAKKLWEEKLNKSNMSNEDICDALIKKAMEGIKSIPLASSIDKEESILETKRNTRSKEAVAKSDINEPTPNESDEGTLRQVKLSLEKNDTKQLSTKVTRSSKQGVIDIEKLETAVKVETTEAKKTSVSKSKKSDSAQSIKLESSQPTTQNDKKAPTQNLTPTLNSLSFDYDASLAVRQKHSEEEKKEDPQKPFNIMDHISMIKVNGVGILFQCKLCNRNFLKLDVVESHSCAKNGVPKVDLPKSVPAPEPPKVPSVKYIKIDSDMKKTLTEKVKLAEKHENEKNGNLQSNIEPEKSEPPPKVKPKLKAGPASKTKRHLIDSESGASQTTASQSTANSSPEGPTAPSVHIPSLPNLNSRFKLVPGPNNMFSLVEDTSASLPANTQIPPAHDTKKPSKKRKCDTVNEAKDKLQDQIAFREKSESPEIIDLEEPTKPYPVGLFQTVNHSQPTQATFTTPAMKKQSYTVVQTGDPSKLLISTKAKAVEMEVPKKRLKKAKHETRDDSGPKEPFTVTLEDVAHPKDTGFFTFINVDPLLQPSYVLPTDNIIQESQISTSSAVVRETVDSKDSKDKGKYSCNMCNEKFTREKKLASHIQSHYKKMDEEDEKRAEKTTKKKVRK